MAFSVLLKNFLGNRIVHAVNQTFGSNYSISFVTRHSSRALDPANCTLHQLLMVLLTAQCSFVVVSLFLLDKWCIPHLLVAIISFKHQIVQRGEKLYHPWIFYSRIYSTKTACKQKLVYMPVNEEYVSDKLCQQTDFALFFFDVLLLFHNEQLW